MTRPTLTQHAQELALLRQERARDREHDAEHDQAVLKGIEDLSVKVESLQSFVKQEVDSINAKHTALDKAVAEAKAMVRGFGAGWAAAFMFIGGAIGAGIANFTGLFK